MDEREVKFTEIPIDKIVPSPLKTQPNCDLTFLRRLARSIRKKGLASPVKVRELPNELYELLSDEKEIQACRMAGLERVPAIIAEKAEARFLIEKLKRKELSYFEEARSCAMLVKYFDMTQEEIAKTIGKSQSYVANKIRLLKFSPEIIALIIENNLSERHARALLKVTDPAVQRDILKRVIESGMSVKETEAAIKEIGRQENETTENTSSTIDSEFCVKVMKSAYELVKNNYKGIVFTETRESDSIVINIVIPKNE